MNRQIRMSFQQQPMTFHPRNRDEVFTALGPRKVRQALINGEFKAGTQTSAEIWLREYGQAQMRFWTRVGGLAAIAAVAATIAIGLFGRA